MGMIFAAVFILSFAASCHTDGQEQGNNAKYSRCLPADTPFHIILSSFIFEYTEVLFRSVIRLIIITIAY